MTFQDEINAMNAEKKRQILESEENRRVYIREPVGPIKELIDYVYPSLIWNSKIHLVESNKGVYIDTCYYKNDYHNAKKISPNDVNGYSISLKTGDNNNLKLIILDSKHFGVVYWDYNNNSNIAYGYDAYKGEGVVPSNECRRIFVNTRENMDFVKRRIMEDIAREQSLQKKGCYIATCVYGSYDCPEVWTLRRFRDSELAKIWYGRAFIKIYYATSPKLVKMFGNNEWIKKRWQYRLDKMVNSLRQKGFEDSPYNDREW